jgi:hypothetical protein
VAIHDRHPHLALLAVLAYVSFNHLAGVFLQQKLMPQNSNQSTLSPIRFSSILEMRLYLHGYTQC